jgi:hypothetical protein
MGEPRKVFVVTSDTVPTKREHLREIIGTLAEGVWKDFKLTNKESAGKALKFGASLVVGGAVAKEVQVLTPLRWALRGFGPLPIEFTKSGAIQVFEYTTVQRAMQVARAAGAKFVLVTVAYEGGVLIGSIINQTLAESSKDAIGGTINEIVNEGGWQLLFKHPFGIGM